VYDILPPTRFGVNEILISLGYDDITEEDVQTHFLDRCWDTFTGDYEDDDEQPIANVEDDDNMDVDDDDEENESNAADEQQPDASHHDQQPLRRGPALPIVKSRPEPRKRGRRNTAPSSAVLKSTTIGGRVLRHRPSKN
jgi:hypothetical protein